MDLRLPSLFALATLATSSACTSAAYSTRGFDVDFPANRPDEVHGIASTLAAHPGAPPQPLVIITPPAPARGLATFALPAGNRLWQSGLRIVARPVSLGDLVLAHAEGGSVVALDARSGRERWRISDQSYSLIGAARDGELVAVSLGPGDLNRREGAFLVLDAASGRALIDRHAEAALGAPAIGAGFAFLPWNGQYLSIFDVGRGEERARIRSADDVYARALHEGGAVYFGARSLYRLSAEAGRGRREGSGAFALPREDLPGNPSLLPDGYAVHPAGVNARERVAVVVRPDPSQPGARPLDGLIYSLFHRVVFAVAAEGGAVRWAYMHGADFAGAQAVRGGLVLVDERGVALMIDANGGHVVWRRELGAPAAQAVLQLPLDFSPPRGESEAAQPPAMTLIAAAGGTDTRLLPARIFAVRALASMPGVDATRGLLDVASRRSYPQALRDAAGEALARRTEGLDVLIDALGTHYDFLRGTLAPPVGFIARAISAARDRRGVAPLIAHLQDPETPATELLLLISALRDLGDPAAVPALMDFVRLYHADEGAVPVLGEGEPVNDRSLPEQEAINAALELAIQVIAQLGGPSERRWLQAMIEDANTLPSLRASMERALSPNAGQATAQNSSEGESSSNSAVPSNLPPARVSAQQIEEAFTPVRDRLLACFNGAPSRPSQLRIQFRYDNTGAISTVTVTPPQWQSCMAPIAQQVRLPASQVTREIGTYYLLGGVQ